MTYPYFQTGDHKSIKTDDPRFATYDEALAVAKREAKTYQDEGTCGAVYGIWYCESDDMLPDLMALVTYEGVFRAEVVKR